MIPLARPHYPPALRKTIAADIEAILASGRLMMGPWAKKFEERFAALTARKFAVSLNSCTTALQIALSFAGVNGKDVLVPAGSFITDVSVVEFAGGRPILVDIDPATLALDLADLKRKVTPDTRALIWVHLTGVIAENFQDILDFAAEHSLFVIEDAAHAHGAEIGGRPAGNFGDASTFSFYPTKVLTSGTGGMLTTDNADLAKFAREIRHFGKQEDTGEIVHYGNDWFLDEIRACIGYHHSGELTTQVARRREIASIYQSCLANQPGIRVLDIPNGNAPAWYQFPVFLDPTIDRKSLMSTMKQVHGVEVKGIYKPTHQEQIFRALDDGTLKSTEKVLHGSLCLPMHVQLSDAEVTRIAGALVVEIRKQLG
ncbi:MAG TPA: DegT/DnrJ/EryC1/StrS family aminotransferase [Alphaproteobacteria bacterium]|nr:DegT/DnrJ/EryC1/StrS family aminotransferase [Alphaproteobacteria bacterium]